MYYNLYTYFYLYSHFLNFGAQVLLIIDEQAGDILHPALLGCDFVLQNHRLTDWLRWKGTSGDWLLYQNKDILQNFPTHFQPRWVYSASIKCCMQFYICPSKSRQQNRQKHPERTSGKPSSPRCVSKYSFTKLPGPRKQCYGVKYSKLQQTLSIFDISSFSQTLYIYLYIYLTHHLLNKISLVWH